MTRSEGVSLQGCPGDASRGDIVNLDSLNWILLYCGIIFELFWLRGVSVPVL